MNVLLRQLGQTKAERKERKQRLKAQKKAFKLLEKQRKNNGCCQGSLFSSCSSDHEALLHPTQQVGRILEASEQNPSVFVESSPNLSEVNGDEKALHVEFAETSDRMGLNLGVGLSNVGVNMNKLIYESYDRCRFLIGS